MSTEPIPMQTMKPPGDGEPPGRPARDLEPDSSTDQETLVQRTPAQIESDLEISPVDTGAYGISLRVPPPQNTAAQDPPSKDRPVQDMPAQGTPAQERVEVQIDGVRVFLTPDDKNFYTNFDNEATKRLFRKIDRRLLIMLGVLYFFAQIDRSALSHAKLAGLKEDIHMSDGEYTVALAVFFAPYCFLGGHLLRMRSLRLIKRFCFWPQTNIHARPEIPSNIILKSISWPARYISILAIVWGTVAMAHAAVQKAMDLQGARFALGVVEYVSPLCCAYTGLRCLCG